MAGMKLEKPHPFTAEEATQRLKVLVDGWSTRHGVQAAWNGNEVKVSGKAATVAIDATVKVEAGKVVAEGKDPGLIIRKVALAYLDKKFSEYFDPKKSIADLSKID